jgi:two-component system, OmpR family, catabolic regulation response regulator CreB
MNPAILLIEDEPAIADTLLYALATEGFSPRWYPTAAAGLAALAEATAAGRPFALLLLDVGLPDANGFELCRRLRAEGHSLPIVFLTARSAEVDRIVGLEIGADDYVVKPFSPREVAARVRVVLRRVAPPAPATPPASAAAALAYPFNHDEERRRIAYRGVALDLTRIEYRLLLVLLGRPGRVYTREQLLQGAWDEPEASLDRTVDAHVKTLRAKLRQVAPTEDPIVTHRGLGYSLRE